MRTILRYIAVLLAAALVFGAARLMDAAPWRNAKKEAASDAETAAMVQPETQPSQTEVTAIQTDSATQPESLPQTQPSEERFLLTFVGDCTLGGRDAQAYAGHGFPLTVGEDYGFPFRNVLKYFETDEMTFLNLEGVFCETKYSDPKAQTFRGPVSYVNILSESSVEAVSLANNHTMDYGQEGYASTVNALEEAGISYAERDTAAVFTTKNGLTIGIYGAVYSKMDTDVITEAIRQLREQVDILIFAPHWGVKMSALQNLEQTDLAHAVMEAGADIIWGSHPQVLQPMEQYNGGRIFYSLGCFSFGGNMNPKDYDSALIQQEVIRSADGSVSLGETIVVPVCISSVSDRNNYQPTPYEEGSEGYVRVLEKLALAEKN